MVQKFSNSNDEITFVYKGYYVIEHTSLAKYYIFQKINMKNKKVKKILHYKYL